MAAHSDMNPTRVCEPSGPFQRFDLQMWLDGCAPGGPADGHLNPLLWTRRR